MASAARSTKLISCCASQPLQLVATVLRSHEPGARLVQGSPLPLLAQRLLPLEPGNREDHCSKEYH